MENDIFLLNEKVSMREQEINRLNVVASGSSSFPSIVANFDQKQAQEKITSQERQIDFINRQNQELLSEMNEIKELVGIAESRDPTDRDRFHLKTIVRKLKLRCDSLAEENKEMGGVIDALKSGRYNESHTAKIMMDDQQQMLRDDLNQVKAELD